ncbi:unnamed protein product, partial [Nesidiocoris tenuis]
MASNAMNNTHTMTAFLSTRICQSKLIPVFYSKGTDSAGNDQLPGVEVALDSSR